MTILSVCFFLSLSACPRSYFGIDPVIVAPQVIRPPPPDLVQQHSPLPTPALGNSPIHRPSPSPSPPYVKAPQSGPGRPSPVSGTGSTSTNHSILRERRNSTSSVTVTGGRTMVTSVTSTERSGVIHRFSRVFILFSCSHILFSISLETYHSNPPTPTGQSNALNAITSPRPDVTHAAGTPPLPPQPIPAAGLSNSRSRNPLRRDLHIHRKDSIKDVIQPSMSDPENPSKSVSLLLTILASFFQFHFGSLRLIKTKTFK